MLARLGSMHACSIIEIPWQLKIGTNVYSCRYRHRNLVPIVGICLGPKYPAVIYELMCNGSLHDYIHVCICTGIRMSFCKKKKFPPALTHTV